MNCRAGDMKICLTIAGSDCISGAGIQEDLKVFSALGVYGTSVVSVVTAQNTSTVSGVRVLDADIVEKQIDAAMELKPDEVKIGLLGSREVVDVVYHKMIEYSISPVLDPVIKSTTGFDFMDDEAIKGLLKLAKISRIVTPNRFEAEILSGVTIRNFEDVKKAAKSIGNCVITDEGIDLFYFNGRMEILRNDKLPFNTHGSGCTFSSALTAYIAKGYSIENAVKNAKNFTYEAIKHSFFDTNLRILNPFHKLEMAALNKDILDALKILNSCTNLDKICPEVGLNIAQAVNYDNSLEGIAEFSGRIVYDNLSCKLVPVGEVSFGLKKHLSRALFSYMQHSKTNNRGLINIAFNKDVLEKLKKNFKVSEFSREKLKEEKNTMETGVKEALKKNPYADIICDAGGVGKEAMIRVFGIDAVDAANKILQAVKK